MKAFIVMPSNAAAIKKQGVLNYGGEVFECEPTLQAREEKLRQVIYKTGAIEIHPFENIDVITGQATCALELIEDMPELNYIVAPVGGGGLLSGTALAANYFSKGVHVYAGEPQGADDTYRSLQSGKREPSQADSIADGLLTTVGKTTFPIIHKYVKGVVTVSDREIVYAMRLLWEKLKMVVEPSGAVPLAAVIKAKEKFKGSNVALIISGGNVDLEKALTLFASVSPDAT